MLLFLKSHLDLCKPSSHRSLGVLAKHGPEMKLSAKRNPASSGSIAWLLLSLSDVLLGWEENIFLDRVLPNSLASLDITQEKNWAGCAVRE